MPSVFLLLPLLIMSTSTSYGAQVTWKPNKSFNLPMNYRDRKLPCSRQTVVFPESLWEAVMIDSDVSVSGLVLPRDGDIVIAESKGINFGPDASANCTDDGNVYYMPKGQSSWADADVWSSPRFDEATPDSERLPCYNDEVIFPADTQFTIFLPNTNQYVKSLYFIGHQFNTFSFETIVKRLKLTDKQFILNDRFETGVIINDRGCQNPVGCPCQKFPLTIDCSGKYCPTPKCQNPIQPEGHCCKICGGYLKTDIGENFNMMAFQEGVADVIRSYGKGNLVYHIGILPDSKVQVIVVDKGDYSGMSAEAVTTIEYRMTGRGFKSVAQISGAPVSKSGMGGKIAISMFFVVVFVMAAIYAYYYKLPQLPEVRYPGISRSSRGVLSRFNRRTDSVVSLTSRRDSTVNLRSTGVGTAFRNPLYDSKRGRVEVTESVAEDE